MEDTKTLVAGAASSQEQLAVAAQNAVPTIVQLSEIVKSGAASLGSPNREAQVMLINSVKDVASALGDLMQSTKSASGKSIQDPAMHHLKDSAKVSQFRSAFVTQFAPRVLASALDFLVKYRYLGQSFIEVKEFSSDSTNRNTATKIQREQ